MKTREIKKVWKQFDENRIVVGIHAYGKNDKELFSYSNKNGISDNETAMQLYNLIARKNTSFKLGFNNSYNAYFRR
jgi:hypothetical protein